MRYCYADPVYPGRGKLYAERTEVDHVELIERMNVFDGWALSTASDALQTVLPLCPFGVKISAWCKPGGSPAALNPKAEIFIDCWEPVIIHRPRVPGKNKVKNYLVAPIPSHEGGAALARGYPGLKTIEGVKFQGLKSAGNGKVGRPGRRARTPDRVRAGAGVKPEAFCFWLFNMLGMKPDDEFTDLYPGSGTVGKAWKKWCRQQTTGLEAFL